MNTLTIPNEPAMLIGFELGFSIRQKLNLDEIDNLPDHTIIKITSGIATVSFGSGLFEKSVLKLGSEGFFNKYTIEALPSIKVILESAIRVADYRMRRK